MEVTIMLVVAFVVLVISWLLQRTDPRLPPSPTRPLPIFGHLLSLSADFGPLFKNWRNKCGDIYSLYFGRKLVVVLNGFDLIKEAFVKNADVFSDRPPFFIDFITGLTGKGVIFSNGPNWKEQRTLSLSILRTFGMGKNLLAEKIQEEVSYYIKYLVSLKSKATNIRVPTNISTSNIICSILIGHRFDYKDDEFQTMMRRLGELVTDIQNVSFINFFFSLAYLPGDYFNGKRSARNMNAVMSMLQGFIDKKSKLLENSNDDSNLIEMYLHERNKRIEAGLATHLDDQNLSKLMFDLFAAGTETTSTTIYWCILYSLHFPEIQEKIYEEIKDKIGTDRVPTIQDKSQLTYLNAVIMETQRLSSIVPLSVTHMTSEDVEFRGYTLPKGTFIVPNLDSVLHDMVTWGEDALCFKPERFIDENNKLKKPEEFIPFSIGRRVCLGEAIAKMELFLFLSSMFQRFKFQPESPNEVPPLKYHLGGVRTPQHYVVRAVERN